MSDLSGERTGLLHRWAFAGLLALLLLFPALASALLIWHAFGTGWGDFLPAWNDEVVYWHEILTFALHGFAGGYYSIEELTPAAPFTAFGTHGPFFPMLYGTVAKVFGWTKTSGPLFNIGAITLALAAFVGLARPRLRHLAAVAALVAVFWPILLYIPTTMQESLHQADAIVLAALFCRLLAANGSSPRLLFLTLMVTAGAALVRPTWSFLFMALALAQSPGGRPREKAHAVMFAVAAVAVFFVLIRFLTAPYPDGFLHLFFARLAEDPPGALIFFGDRLLGNILALLRFDRCSALEVLLRYVILALLVYSAYFSWRGQSSETEDNRNERALICFSFYNLLFILTFTLLFYDIGDWRDFRVLAPHLLLSLLILAMTRKKRVVVAAVLAFLLLSPVFYKTFLVFHQVHFKREVDLVGHFSPIAAQIRYDKEKGSWANSLLVDIGSMQYFLTDVSPGIGIGGVLNWNRIAYPLKSRYVFVPSPVYLQIKNRAHLRLLSSGPLGHLFVNLDCPVEQDHP